MKWGALRTFLAWLAAAWLKKMAKPKPRFWPS